MALSKDKEKKAAAIFERVLDEYVKKNVINATEHSAENLSIVFGYKNTENLVKHSKTLTGLTIGLIMLGVGMIALA
ncbi:unnamed protein product, partial [marine sediment metagenome]